MSKYSTNYLLFLLAPLVCSFAIGQDIFVPEVPHLVEVFHTSGSTIQLALSLFMLAAGVGQLFVGPLVDQLGRRPIILASVLLYGIGSIIAAIMMHWPVTSNLSYAIPLVILGSIAMLSILSNRKKHG